jgi:hypothetical protein
MIQRKLKYRKSKRIALLSESDWAISLYQENLPLKIGRSDDNSIISLNDVSVSRNHCMLKVKEGQLFLKDTDSKNGTLVGDILIRNEEIPITKSTCLVFGITMLNIIPCNKQGEPIWQENETPSSSEKNGICIVDICNSTQIDLKNISDAVLRLRKILIGNDANGIKLLKQTGVGYLGIYHKPISAFNAAKRLLEWQKNKKENSKNINIRVTLDAGPTFPTLDNDLMGLAINRCSRIEKTKIDDFEFPGKRIDRLEMENRCLLSKYIRRELRYKENRKCRFIGRRMLKGFGGKLFSIYQYE